MVTSLRSPPPGIGSGRALPPLRADQSPCRPGPQPRPWLQWVAGPRGRWRQPRGAVESLPATGLARRCGGD
eukprot:8135846-Prorocentrum_lima.AAC.1